MHTSLTGFRKMMVKREACHFLNGLNAQENNPGKCGEPNRFSEYWVFSSIRKVRGERYVCV